jgi:hypothetical protein
MLSLPHQADSDTENAPQPGAVSQLLLAQESHTLVAATGPPLNRVHLPQSPVEAVKNAHMPQRLLLSVD